jgi:hypothetical protein
MIPSTILRILKFNRTLLNVHVTQLSVRGNVLLSMVNKASRNDQAYFSILLFGRRARVAATVRHSQSLLTSSNISAAATFAILMTTHKEKYTRL